MPLVAVYIQRTAHQVGKALDHRHAQPGALHFGNAAVLGPDVILGDVADELRRHADAGIGAAEDDPPALGRQSSRTVMSPPTRGVLDALEMMLIMIWL